MANPTKKPRKASDLPDAIIKERSIDQLLGNITPSKAKKSNSVSVTFSGMPTITVPDRTELNSTEKAIRAQNKRIFADYGLVNATKLIELAETTDNDMVEYNIRKFIHEQNVGKAANAPQEGNSQLQFPQIKVDFSGNIEDDGPVIDGYIEETNDE